MTGVMLLIFGFLLLLLPLFFKVRKDGKPLTIGTVTTFGWLFIGLALLWLLFSVRDYTDKEANEKNLMQKIDSLEGKSSRIENTVDRVDSNVNLLKSGVIVSKVSDSPSLVTKPKSAVPDKAEITLLFPSNQAIEQKVRSDSRGDSIFLNFILLNVGKAPATNLNFSVSSSQLFDRKFIGMTTAKLLTNRQTKIPGGTSLFNKIFLLTDRTTTAEDTILFYLRGTYGENSTQQLKQVFLWNPRMGSRSSNVDDVLHKRAITFFESTKASP